MLERFWEHSRFQQGCLVALALYAGGCLFFVVAPAAVADDAAELKAFTTGAFLAFSLGHAVWRMGWPQTLLLFSVSVVLSLSAELAGVLTGITFGGYHYTDRLGWKLFGLVPVIIPLAWFTMIYASHTLAEMLSRNENSGAEKSGMEIGRRAFLTALAMTAWDLALDPQMVASRHWVWAERGAYFGIPLHNFGGWLTTTFLISLVFRIAKKRLSAPPVPDGEVFARLPIVAYALTGIASASIGLKLEQAGPAIIGSLAMGTFIAAAWARPLTAGALRILLVRAGPSESFSSGAAWERPG